MRLPYKIKFIGAPNTAYMTENMGKRKLIAKFNDEGFYITDDAETSVLLEKKGLPYIDVESKKETTAKKTKELFDDKK